MPWVLIALGGLPALSPEIGPTPATGLPADNSEHYAMAASNGSGFMVVWQDFRGSDHPSGTRLDSAARVLDPLGLPVGSPTFGRNPNVGSDGQDYLVVWEDYRSDFRGYVYGERFTAAGVALDPGGFQISSYQDEDQVPSVAFGAGTYLVAWADYSSGSLRIWGARITPTGAVLDPLGIPISLGPNEYGPSVAFDGTNFLVTWYDNTTIRAARVTPTGLVLDVPPINVTGGRYPAAGFDGQDFLLLYNLGTDIYGARVATDGGVLDPAGFPVSAGSWSEYYPSIACTPSSCAGVWIDNRDAGAGYLVYGARIDQAGSVIDDAGVPFMGSDSYRPAIAFNGTNYLIASDQRVPAQAPNVYGTLASPSTFAPVTPGGDLFSTAVAAQYDPRVASDGTDFLLVWADDRNIATTGEDIFAARVAADAGLIDRSGFSVSTAPGRQLIPTVTFTGSDYLVAWLDYRDGGGSPAIWGSRVSQAGGVLDPNGFPITAPGPIGSVQMAGLDGGALVVWEDGRNQADSGTDLYFARVDQRGTVRDPGGLPLVTAPSFQVSPALDSNGTSAIVAWTDYRSGTSADIYAARIDGDGTVSPPNGQAISAGPQDERTPAVAVGHGQALVVWEDGRDSGKVSGIDLYAARIAPDLGVLDPGGFDVTTAPDSQRAPSATFDGAEYLIAWEESRNSRGFFGQITDLWATRVTPTGAVLDDAGFAVSEDPYDEYSAAAASDRQGHVLVAYNRAPADTVDRALARVVTGQALLGDPCGSSAVRCASGFCVDGVCCDSACGGGDPTDCMACDAAGQCVTLGTEAICRPPAGLCDLPERCDGNSTTCPSDAFRSSAAVCRPAAGDCDTPESCTGRDPDCPPDALLSSTTTCRPTAGPCDIPESCTGQSATCPADDYAARGTSCGNEGEVCSGTSPQCELNLQAGCGCTTAPTLDIAALLLLVGARRRQWRRSRSARGRWRGAR